jgi:hypothetical protein
MAMKTDVSSERERHLESVLVEVWRTPAVPDVSSAQERRLELARKAFKEFYAQCFWSADPDLPILEQHIPFVIRGLRLHGGHKGYGIVAQLCQ